jgi:hypothetical protein
MDLCPKTDKLLDPISQSASDALGPLAGVWYGAIARRLKNVHLMRRRKTAEFSKQCQAEL